MSNYSRQYTNRINNNSGWENYTSTATPLSAANLNKMDQAIQNIDNAAYNAINTKANQATVNGCINSITFDSDTGVFTISFVNGTSTTINTALEKVVTNFTYNSSTQSLVLTLADGSTQSISLAEFITQYEFEDTDTIGFTVTNGKVKAAIVNGSIGSDQMDPDYLADCEEQVDTAKDYARQSQSYALGNAVDDEGDPYRSGQSTDNAKYYCQQAQQAASESGAAPFIGATSTTGGVKGLVPAPLIADREKFLKGSGGWAEVNLDPFTGATSSTAGAKGMVPQPSAGDEGKILMGDGSWHTLGAFTGATSQGAGTEGLVPQPTAGDQDKVLTGGGIWTANTANLITNFTSSDNTGETGIITSAGGEASMSKMTSGDNHGGLFGGLSKAVLNTRKLINTAKRIWETVANTWVSGASYSVGQVVTYTNGHTYICKLAHTSSSSITPANTTYWEDKTIGDMIYSLNSNYMNATVTQLTFTGNYVNADDCVMYQWGKLVILCLAVKCVNPQSNWVRVNTLPRVLGNKRILSVLTKLDGNTIGVFIRNDPNDATIAGLAFIGGVSNYADFWGTIAYIKE